MTGAGFELDPAQRAVVDLADDASAAVLGAPGSGKTTAIVELVANRVIERGWSPDELLVLTSTRATATRLRDRLALRLGRATNGPLARTANSLAYELVAARARVEGVPVPRLITGAEQDADIAELLQHSDEHNWPEELGPDVRRLGVFRTELRELMGRATEYGVDAIGLAALGRERARPEWVAASAFWTEYLRAVSGYREAQLDSSEFARFAVAAIDDGVIGERFARLRLLVLDDAQEATEATLAVVRAFAARGVAVIAMGDPDIAGNAFRGGEPDVLGRLSSTLGLPVQTLRLDRVHRGGPAIRALVSRVTGRIGTAGAGTQRAAAAGEVSDAVTVVSAPSPARERAAIARLLREAHLDDLVSWDDMLVIARSGAEVPAMRRALALAEVPTRTAAGGVPVRDARAARGLLDLVDVGIGRRALDAGTATELLTGAFGGLDRLSLRRLRLALRTEELAGGGSRTADELLVDALGDPARLATIDHRVARRAARLAGTLQVLRTAEHSSVEELLWVAWERSGLARTWFEAASGAGIAAAEADENLDAVVAVFTAARRFVERSPDRKPADFVNEMLGAEVSEDSLTAQRAGAAVLVTTPSGAVGLEADTVVITGLQEGVWPNLRLRGSLLGPQELVRAVTGVDSVDLDERRLVLDDELRMFALAASRARRRVVLTAVENEDEAASVLVAFAPAGSERVDASGVSPLTLRGMTGLLRRELTASGTSPLRREAAASGLAQLASVGVPGADPSSWHGLDPVSSDEPLYLDDEKVPVSPSQLGTFEESPLDWFIDMVSGSRSSVVLGLGTIMHWAMETVGDPSVDAIVAAVDSRWSELVFESEWLSEASRRSARVFAAGIAEYLGDFARDGGTLAGAESRFELDVDRATVRGSIDRIERTAAGAVVIVDLKTGTPARAGDIPEHPQLSAYQLAYAAGVLDDVLEEFGDHVGGGAKLLWVKEGVGGKSYRESVQAAFDADAIEAFRARIRIASYAMAQAEYAGLLEPPARGGPPGWEQLIHRVGTVSGD